MILDSTVLVDVLRDKTGRARRKLDAVLQGNPYVLTRWTELELMRGAVDEGQWTKLETHLRGETYVEATVDTWSAAARIHFDAKRRGKSIRSIVDCCIAQLAIENSLTLIHNDRDFEVIATVRDLRLARMR
jgi:predicted nucleic acid-binding protein